MMVPLKKLIMTTKVEIIDLGINNIGSVKNAFARLENVDISVLSKASDSKEPDLLVLPGNGTFSEGMKQLILAGFDEMVLDRHGKERPILGICLGMQLLFEKSEEGPTTKGLGILKKGLSLLDSTYPIPHAGWEDALWAGNQEFPHKSEETKSYYFMHSYAALDVSPENVMAITKRGGGEFISAVKVGETVAVQFHPEKSSKNGANFLKDVKLWCDGKI